MQTIVDMLHRVIVDVHAHCIPQSFRDWLTEHGDRVGARVEDGAKGQCVQFEDGPRTGDQYSWDSLSDMGRRLAEMDRMDIGIQMLAGWVDLAGYELPAATALEYARAHNECLASEASVAPDRFRPLGTVPLQDEGLAVMALEQAMSELGMAGAQLGTRVGDVYLGEVELDHFWSAAAEKGAFLVLHPVRPLEGVKFGGYFLENSVGRPAESTVALGSMIMSGVFERHPGLRVCVVHGGGFIPFQIGRLDRSFHEVSHLAGGAISRPPSTYLDQVYVDTIVHDPTALRFTIDRLGSSHVMVGTDYPFPMGDDDPMGTVAAVDGLTEEEVARIQRDNAMSLLRPPL